MIRFLFHPITIATYCLLAYSSHAQEGLDATLDQTRTSPFSDPTNAGSWKLVESMSDTFAGEIDVQNKWRRSLYYGPDVDPSRIWEKRGSVEVGYENHFTPENVYPVSIVDADGNPVNGELVIDTKVQPDMGETKQYSSGWLQSLRGLKYGYFEIKAKTGGPESGTNDLASASSAFWLVKKTPLSWAEIDVFEIGGNSNYGSGESNRTNMNLHYFTYQGDPQNGEVDNFATPLSTPVGYTHFSDYHIYGFEWTADHMRWFVDGKQVRELKANNGTYSLSQGAQSTQTAYDMPLNVLLGMEVFGSNWFGLPEADSSFHIDYVKVWSKKGDNGNLITNGTMDSMDGWQTFGVNKIVEITDEGELSVELTQVPEDDVPWNTIIRSNSFIVSPGATYNLSFDAWSTTQRPISAKIGAPAAPFTTYIYSTEMIPKSDPTLDPSFRNRVTFNLTFEVSKALGIEDVAAQLEFFVGRDPKTAGMTGAAWPDADSDASRYLGKVCLDNIELTELPDASLPFILDGDLSELTEAQRWNDSIGETTTGVDFREMRIAELDDHLLIAIANRHDISEIDSSWVLFFDTDKSLTTGYATHGMGADYIIRDRYLYAFTGEDQSTWAFTRRGQIPFAKGSEANATNVEYCLPKAWINNTSDFFVGVWNSATNDKMGDLEFGFIELTNNLANDPEYIALQAQLTDAQTTMISVQESNTTLQLEIAALITHNESLEADTTSLLTANETLLQENATLTSANESLETNNASLQQENSELLAQTETIPSLQTANETLLQENAALIGSNEGLQTNNTSLQQQNSDLLTQTEIIPTLQTANEELTAENTHLKEIIDIVKETVSPPLEQP